MSEAATPGAPGEAASVVPRGPVVDPGWLEARLGASALRPVDLRNSEAYAGAHVPGAVHLELAALGTSLPGQDNVLLAADAFATLMRELGISADTTVVAYDDQWGLAAARLLWALHSYGHTAAAVLDGGWDRWTEEAKPVTDTVPSPERGRFTAVPTPEVRVTREWLAERLGASGPALLDTRTRGEFDQGHIPGAVSWDWFNAVPAGSWDVARDLDELRAEWTTLGVHPERETVVYCRSGMRAAHTYMVLKLAGFGRVRLYDGSWQEWCLSGEEPADG